MRRTIPVFLLSVFLTLAVTFPLILRLNTSIPGFHSTDEPYGILWNFWWLKYSYFHHFKMYFSPFIISPFGINLAGSPVYPVGDFINRFLTIGLGEIAAYNLQTLLSFILSAIFMYYLVYSLARNRLAALFSAIVYSFCPYHFARSWQHPSLAQIQWLPLYILSLYRLKQEAKLKNIILTALSISLIFFFNYYYAYFASVITLAFIISLLVYEKRKSFTVIKSMAMSILIASLVLLPIILPIFKTIIFSKTTADLAVAGYSRAFNDLFEQSARPLSYFLPASAHPLFGGFTERFMGSSFYGMSFVEHALYLGWVPLALAFIAFKRRKRVRGIEIFYIGSFIFLAAVAWLFSQPPWWNLGPLKIYMPSFFMYKALPMFRAYCRFGIVVMLAVAVLAGFGLKFILEKFKDRKSRLIVTALFCAGVLFEFWNYPPFKIIDLSAVPQAYYWLKAKAADTVIAEYPLDTSGPNELYKFYQTRHEKRMINAPIPGTYPHRVAQSLVKLSKPQTTAALRQMGVKYALVHKEDYLKTEFVEDREELGNIPRNLGLELIKSFPAEECPQKETMCARNTGPIDVYEVVAEPAQEAASPLGGW